MSDVDYGRLADHVIEKLKEKNPGLLEELVQATGGEPQPGSSGSLEQAASNPIEANTSKGAPNKIQPYEYFIAKAIAASLDFVVGFIIGYKSYEERNPDWALKLGGSGLNFIYSAVGAVIAGKNAKALGYSLGYRIWHCFVEFWRYIGIGEAAQEN